MQNTVSRHAEADCTELYGFSRWYDGVYWCFSNSAFSNLQRHLMSKHADEWKQFHSSDSAGQSCNQSSMKSFVTVPVPPAKAEMLDLLFGKMLIDTNMPLTFSANA